VATADLSRFARAIFDSSNSASTDRYVPARHVRLARRLGEFAAGARRRASWLARGAASIGNGRSACIAARPTRRESVGPHRSTTIASGRPGQCFLVATADRIGRRRPLSRLWPGSLRFERNRCRIDYARLAIAHAPRPSRLPRRQQSLRACRERSARLESNSS
jgi:hypothetical protein